MPNLPFPPAAPVEEPSGRRPVGRYHEHEPLDEILADPKLVESLVGEWAPVILRIIRDSPAHWGAVTLLLVGLNDKLQDLRNRMDGITKLLEEGQARGGQ